MSLSAKFGIEKIIYSKIGLKFSYQENLKLKNEIEVRGTHINKVLFLR